MKNISKNCEPHSYYQVTMILTHINVFFKYFLVFTFMLKTLQIHVLHNVITYQLCLVVYKVLCASCEMKKKASNYQLPLKVMCPPPLLIDSFKVLCFNHKPLHNYLQKHFSLSLSDTYIKNFKKIHLWLPFGHSQQYS
jgi:hypothetical protein